MSDHAYCHVCGTEKYRHDLSKCQDCGKLFGWCCGRLESIYDPLLCSVCNVLRNERKHLARKQRIENWRKNREAGFTAEGRTS